MTRPSILAAVLIAGLAGLTPVAFAGLGPFYVVTYDPEGREAGRTHVVSFAGNVLTDADGEPVGRVEAVQGRPLPSALFVIDGVVSVEWDGEGATGPLATGGAVVELVRPTARSIADSLSGLIWIGAMIAGAAVWGLFRDSFWRRSVSL